ncbi:hypothetical protein [Nitrososphaera sp.]|uniref:hypothetical protein n=1 Tax=Nitrososphaera sp. TaxID=1971748 RepID=UPI0018172ED2|nr:hypothetical protein [Nitrososphaera sp.]NWG37805.1 hypothetical protein [Nitrososphaera sp.]
MALNRDNLDDAIHYLKEIQREVNDYLDYMQVKKERAAVEEAVRKNLKEALKEHKTHVKKLKRELKKHRFPLSATPDESKTAKKRSKVTTVFPTILKAVQISRSNPEKEPEDGEPLASVPVDPAELRKPVVVSNTGEEMQDQDGEPEEPAGPVEAKESETIGAPVKMVPEKAPAENPGEVQIQRADREKLAKVADVTGSLSLSQWSEILGFRRSSSAHQFLERMSEKGLVDLQKSMEGVEVRLNAKGRSALESVEVAGAR